MDHDLVERAAREFIDRHRWDAMAVLWERAELAEAATADLPSAETWREIAEAAHRIIG